MHKTPILNKLDLNWIRLIFVTNTDRNNKYTTITVSVTIVITYFQQLTPSCYAESGEHSTFRRTLR